jgi:hypothetical protein
VTQQVEDHFVAHYDEVHGEIGDHTYTDLAEYYGSHVTKSQVRAAMMNIAPALTAQGKSLTIPDRYNGWRFRVTDSEMDVLRSWRYRLQAFISETIRVSGNAKGCAHRSAAGSRALDDLAIELGNLLGAINSAEEVTQQTAGE